MKKTLLPLLAALSLFSSCSKDDDKPQDIVLLQKLEAGNETISFQYNEQNLLTKMEMLEKRGEAFSVHEYMTVTYADGIPVKAEIFRKPEATFYREVEVTFNLNTQKRIGYAVRKYFNPDGSPDGDNDTTDFTYNADNRIIKVVDREYPTDFWNLAYDAQGNYKPANEQREDEYQKTEMTYDFRYDNGINPFATNGIGYMIFVVYGGDFFSETMLLSVNNNTLEKEIRKYTYKNGGGDPDVSETTYTTEITNTYDEQGLMKELDINSAYVHKYNNVVQETDNNSQTVKVTCVKKQQ